MCLSSFLVLLEYRQSVFEENRRIAHYPSSFLNPMIVERESETEEEREGRMGGGEEEREEGGQGARGEARRERGRVVQETKRDMLHPTFCNKPFVLRFIRRLHGTVGIGGVVVSRTILRMDCRLHVVKDRIAVFEKMFESS